MTVSFVVPCWNDANRLAQLLDSLAKLHPLPEIIVADASDDRAPVEALVAGPAPTMWRSDSQAVARS